METRIDLKVENIGGKCEESDCLYVVMRHFNPTLGERELLPAEQRLASERQRIKLSCSKKIK